MAYILYADITDQVARAFPQATIEAYLSEVDAEIVDVAETMGLLESDIDTDYRGTGRVHYKIIRFGVMYLLYRLFEDKMFVNNVDSSQDEKYYLKMNHYKERADKLRDELTREMYRDQVDGGADRAASTGILYRA